LLKLRKIDYASSIAKDLDIDKTTATYHIEKLVYLGLIQKYGDRPDRTLYKITEKGEMILDMVNTPE
jgi:DNA-binding MarR family transcriptional regulator